MQLFLFGFSPVQTEVGCHASDHEHRVRHTHISVKSNCMKTQPTCDLSYRTLCKLFHVLEVCLYAEDASRGGLEKKKSGRKLSLFKTAILEKKFSHTSGVSPSSHTACTGRSPIKPCSSSYLEEDFTHFVHFLPV